MNPQQNQMLTLDDGRLLNYACYGDASAQPLLVFHGNPGSHRECPADIPLLTDLELRLIVFARPGFGASDPQANRCLLDCVTDVEQLANALDLSKMMLLGFSAGGPYAAACAARLPDRVDRLALVNSIAPLDAPGVFTALNPTQQALYSLAADDSTQLEGQLIELAQNPEAVFAFMQSMLPDCDRRIFADPAFASMYLSNISAAIKQGVAGILSDMVVATQSWGFDLSSIQVPVHIWHGEADQTLPVTMGHYLATAIAHCQRHFVPDAGHYLLFNQQHKVLKTLCQREMA